MKIFVVDPALKDQRGHHYALTANISRNCEALGHNVICLVNKSLSQQTEEGLYFVRCFSSDTYDGHAKPKAQASAAEKPTQGAQTPAPIQKQNQGQPQTQEESQTQEEPKKHPITRMKHGLISIYRLLPVSLREVTTPFFYRVRERTQASTFDPATVLENEETSEQPKPTPVSELLGALKNHSAAPEDVVLFHTSDAHTYRDIVELFVEVIPVDSWNKLPQFHLSTPYDGSTMPHNLKYPPFTRSVQQLSDLGLIGKKVFLHAEHVLLANHLSEVLLHPVTALPIPPLTELPARSPECSELSMNVMYLGAARTEKGFTTLPAAIQKILQQTPKLDIHFHIQITPQIMGYTPDVLKAVEKLREVNDERLHLIDKPLSQSEYQQLLANADAMLLNYNPERYKFRGSGIAVESVLSATSLIAPKTTFPEYIGGNSGVFTDYPGGIESAIQQIYKDLQSYRSKALKRREWYLSEHSAAKFVQVLDEAVREIDSEIHAETNRYADSTQWQPLL